MRPTLTLALPIMAGMLSQMLMGLTDTIMIGQVGVVPLAASAFVHMLFHLPMVFGFGLLSSISVLTSQAFGGRRREETGEVLRHGLILAAAAGVLMALTLAASRIFHHRLGQPAEVVAEAGAYHFIISASIVPMVVGYAAKQFSEALNRPWTPNWIMLGSVLLNVLLNWILIYGHWGAPELGLAGAGWATLLARVVMMVAMLLLVIRSTALRPYQPPRWFVRPCRALTRRLMDIGWPVALQHLLEFSAFSFAVLMMGWISAEAIAAHQIAITCAATTFMLPLGIGMAISIRVGQAWGAGQDARVRRIGLVGVLLAVMVMGCAAVVFITAGEFIARGFVDSAGVISLAASLLTVAAIFQIADGTQVVSLSALRGLSDVKIPTLIAVLAYWLVAMPLGYLLAFPLGQGAVGVWIGLATGLGTAAAGLVWRFVRRTRRARSPGSLTAR